MNACMHRFIRGLGGALATILFIISAPSVAGDFGALSIFPTRLVIENNQRSGALTLRNNASSEVTYRLSLVEIGLNDQGGMVKLEAPYPEAHRSAANFVRYSPRQIRLRSGESQVIRVMVKNRRKMEEVEYRSHLEIRALPKVDEQSLADSAKDNDKTLSVKTNTRVGISLPIIVRNGQTQASVSLKELALSNNKAGTAGHALLTLARSGNRSVYGDIVLEWRKDGESKATPIGLIKGYALYHPTHTHPIRIPLSSKLSAKALSEQGKVRAHFTDDESARTRGNTWLDTTTQAVFVE